MNKAVKDLGKKIGKEHYVKLSSEAKKEAAEMLEGRELVRIYEADGVLWAKARTREALVEMQSWS